MRLFKAGRDVNIAVIVIPGGYAMAPPELARNTPVLDIFHPVVISLAPVLGDKTDTTIFNGFDRRLRQWFGTHEPLIGQIGLDNHAGTITVGTFVNMVFGLDQQSLGVKIE